MITTTTLASRGGPPPQQFAAWAATLDQNRGFSEIAIPKRRRREMRVVLRPSVGLDRTLKQLHAALDATLSFEPDDCVHGFVPNRGIVTNASQHLNRDVVLKIDLRDFFGSVARESLVSHLIESGLEPEAADAVASVTTVKNALPQGFSTSPMLSNIAFHTTDAALRAVAAGRGATYSRYADDLTFSGRSADIDDNLLVELTCALGDHGWSVNERKTRFMRRGHAQYVTGLSVDDPAGPHVPRVFKRTLRRELYFATKYGLTDAWAHSPRALTRSQLHGWVEFLAHVEPHRKAELRAAWRTIAPRTAPAATETWDALLDEIGFPANW